MKVITATEASRRFAAVLDEAERGETIVVTRGGRRIAVIGPAPVAAGQAVKSMLRRHRPDDDWEDDLRAVRAVAEDRPVEWPDD
jgi:prevent-host-death family protein